MNDKLTIVNEADVLAMILAILHAPDHVIGVGRATVSQEPAWLLVGGMVGERTRGCQ